MVEGRSASYRAALEAGFHEIAVAAGWSNEEVARRKEAVRVVFLEAKQESELRSERGFILSRFKLMTDDEVAEAIARGRPKPKAHWWEIAQERAREERKRRERERREAEDSMLRDHPPDIQERWRRVKQGKFTSDAFEAAWARLEGDREIPTETALRLHGREESSHAQGEEERRAADGRGGEQGPQGLDENGSSHVFAEGPDSDLDRPQCGADQEE